MNNRHSMKTPIIGLLLTSFLLLSGCGGGSGGDGGPSISSLPGSTGAIATLAWDPVQDPSIVGYYVHYGRTSSAQPGACAYESAQFVSSPNVTITNLDNNTHYYFAVSAYNGAESACSNEVSTLTPPSAA